MERFISSTNPLTLMNLSDVSSTQERAEKPQTTDVSYHIREVSKPT